MRSFKVGKTWAVTLDQPSADERGRDRNHVNVGPLQFGKETDALVLAIWSIHFRLAPTDQTYFTFGTFTMLPLACWSFGSFTTVTYSSFSSFPKATLVVPSPAAISKT
jgi:hypothetical protein